VLSAVEFDVVWERLGLGPTPVVLQLPSPGRTHTERRRLVADTWAALRDRELARAVGPEPGLDRLLRLLAGPVERLELRAWGRHPVRAVAAGYDDGVLARRAGDHVVLEPCTSVPGAIVGLLPPAPPGPGRTASVPTATLTAVLDRPSGAGLHADLLDRGVPPDEACPLARMVQAPVGHAQVGVLAPDRWGVLRRSANVLDVLDGPRGRYLVTRRDGWTTVAPTDGRRLRHRLAELVAAACGRSQSRSPCRISCRPDSVIEPDSDG
jgi:EspG family